MVSMSAFRRHDLVSISQDGWSALLDGDWDDEARDCLAHWAAHALALVVARQSGTEPLAAHRQAPEPAVALGLPAPTCWSRRRLMLRLPVRFITATLAFPSLDRVLARWSSPAYDDHRDLSRALATAGFPATVYGSYGWQHMTGLSSVRDGSDIDLIVRVATIDEADQAAGLLNIHAENPKPRVDGELIFPDGSAVAWREWLQWRAGRTRSLLVKDTTGASLHLDTSRWTTNTEGATA
jgi:phosphoribosyl-dephospho-CoA transferase